MRILLCALFVHVVLKALCWKEADWMGSTKQRLSLRRSTLKANAPLKYEHGAGKELFEGRIEGDEMNRRSFEIPSFRCNVMQRDVLHDKVI
jgi:hypothetical protein